MSASSESPGGPVTDLLLRWEERRLQGQSITPAELCREHPDLLDEVTRRIAALEEIYGLPRQVRTGPHLPPDGADEKLVVPGYRIDSVLGRGGMGVVYRAEQLSLKRTVALKVMAGLYTGPRERWRFRIEAEAASALQHPNIVQVFEVGETRGFPFLAMEYVSGGTLAHWLQDKRPTPAEAAEVTATLARAVQCAHQAGIVHRDLKPANVLLSFPAKSRAAEGIAARDLAEPKITDFGLAKRLDTAAELTRTGEVMGTPAYMAPEQALGKGHLVGPAADIYALGVILYEMLTGTTPFHGSTVIEVLEQVVNREPVRPTRITRAVPHDLDVICLKCLQKEPHQRYPSAHLLAEDLDRFLQHKPIRARPAGRIERLVKWGRRHPTLAGLVLVSCLALLAFTAAVTFFSINAQLQTALVTAETERNRADQERSRADQLRDEAEQFRHHVSYARDLMLAQQAWEIGQPARMLDLLDAWGDRRGQRPDLRGWEWRWLRRLPDQYLARYSAPLGLRGPVASPDGRWLAAVSDLAQAVYLWDRSRAGQLHTIPFKKGWVSLATFTSDSRFLVTNDAQGGILYHDLATTKAARRETVDFKGWFASVVSGSSRFAVFFTEDAREGSCLFDIDRGKILHRWKVPLARAAISANGEQVVGFGPDHKMHRWDGQTGKELPARLVLQRQPRAAALFLDGGGKKPGGPPPRCLLALTIPEDFRVRLVDLEDNKELPPLTGPRNEISTLAFSPDGRFLASGGWERIVRLWDVATRQERHSFRGHDKEISGLIFTGDKELISVGVEGRALCWALPPVDQEGLVGEGFGKGHARLAFRPDGKRIAVGGGDGGIRLYDLELSKGSLLQGPCRNPDCLAFSFDGRMLIEGGRRFAGLVVWDLLTSTPKVLKLNEGGAVGLALRPGADTGRAELACVTYTSFSLYRWEAATGKLLAPPRKLPGVAPTSYYSGLVFLPEGKTLILSRDDGRLTWMDVESGKTIATRDYAGRSWRSLTISPDGKQIALGAAEGTILLRDSSWQEDNEKELRGHLQHVIDLAFSKEGRLFSGSWDQTVKVWDVARGLELLTLRNHTSPVRGVAVSPNGQKVVSIDTQGVLRLWPTK
jgi:WD40 repeat protein